VVWDPLAERSDRIGEQRGDKAPAPDGRAPGPSERTRAPIRIRRIRSGFTRTLRGHGELSRRGPSRIVRPRSMRRDLGEIANDETRMAATWPVRPSSRSGFWVVREMTGHGRICPIGSSRPRLYSRRSGARDTFCTRTSGRQRSCSSSGSIFDPERGNKESRSGEGKRVSPEDRREPSAQTSAPLRPCTPGGYEGVRVGLRLTLERWEAVDGLASRWLTSWTGVAFSCEMRCVRVAARDAVPSDGMTVSALTQGPNALKR